MHISWCLAQTVVSAAHLRRIFPFWLAFRQAAVASTSAIFVTLQRYGGHEPHTAKKCSMSHKSAESWRQAGWMAGRWLVGGGWKSAGWLPVPVPLNGTLNNLKSSRTMAVWLQSGESNTSRMCPMANVQSFISWTTRECIPPAVCVCVGRALKWNSEDSSIYNEL